MDKDEILEIVRQEILDNLTIHVDQNHWEHSVNVVLKLNGDIISRDYFTLPTGSEG